MEFLFAYQQLILLIVNCTCIYSYHRSRRVLFDPKVMIVVIVVGHTDFIKLPFFGFGSGFPAHIAIFPDGLIFVDAAVSGLFRFVIASG